MAMIVQKPKKKWYEMIEDVIKELEKENLDDCKDRLDMAKKLGRLVVILIKSVHGWQQWMNFETMDTWTKEEFLDIYPRYKQVLIEFLKIDAEITKKKEEEIDKRVAELKKKQKKGKECKGCKKPKDKKNIMIV